MKKPAKSKTTARKKKGTSPKLLAHLKRLNMSRRKKKPAKAAKKAAPKKPAKKHRKAPAAKPAAPTPAPAPTPIPPVELPKGDHPGQVVMSFAATPEPAITPAPLPSGASDMVHREPAKTPGEELL